MFVATLIFTTFSSLTTYAQESYVPCPCNCNQIMYSENGGGYGKIRLVKVGNCYEFKFKITGCGNRTVNGFNMIFPKDELDLCLNRNWTIFLGANDQNLGTFNPIYDAPLIGFFYPPVGPCESRDFFYKLCPQHIVGTNDCLGEQYDIGIEFIFNENDEPCPRVNRKIVFDLIFNAETEIFNYQNVKVIYLDNQIHFDNINLLPIDTEIAIFDISGNLILQFDYNANLANNLPISQISSGSYYCSFINKGKLIGNYKFTILK